MMNEIKQGYKQTDIGVIPEDWEVVKLGKISTNMGYGVGASAVIYDGINKYIRITDIDDETHSFIPSPLSSPSFFTESYLANEGDILFARTGASVGKSYIYNKKDGKLIIAGFLIRLNILDALPKYVYFQTLANRYKEWVLSESARTGQPGLNLEQYKSFEIPIPKNTDEQIAIATALSEVDALIAALDKKITKKQQIKQGAMQQLLTGKKRLPGFSGEWMEKTIGQSLTIKHGKSQKDIEVPTGRYPILGTGGVIGFTNTPLYTKQSVLIGRKGTIDKPYFYNTPFWTVDTLFYSEIREEYCAKFIFYKFNQIDWYAYNEASGVPSLNAKVIESIVIAFPPTLAEQTAIAQILTDMDNEISQLETDRNKYEQIKAGMMQQLLTGKIRLVN